MGTVNLEVCTSMKFLIVVALAGVAVADPDAGYLYGGYAGHLVPTVSGGLVPSGGPLVPGLGVYGGYGGYAHHGYAGYAGLVPTSSGGLVPAGGPWFLEFMDITRGLLMLMLDLSPPLPEDLPPPVVPAVSVVMVLLVLTTAMLIMVVLSPLLPVVSCLLVVPLFPDMEPMPDTSELISSPLPQVVLSQLAVPSSPVSMDSTRGLLMSPSSPPLPEDLSPPVVPVMPVLLVMLLAALCPLVVPVMPVLLLVMLIMEVLWPLHPVVLSLLEVPLFPVFWEDILSPQLQVVLSQPVVPLFPEFPDSTEIFFTCGGLVPAYQFYHQS